MKKKIINGILLGAMLVASSSAFVSCKDNDADVSTELKGQYSTLAQQLQALQTQVSGIKSCACDASLASKVSALESAVAALQAIDHNSYVKVADLPAAVQELLTDYVKNDVLGKYLTKEELEAILADYAKKGETTPGGLTKEEVEAILADYVKKGDLTQGMTKEEVEALLAGYAKKDDLTPGLTKEEVETIVKEIISATQIDVTVLYGTMVTSISVEQVSNPIFDFITPFDVKTNFLIACYGDAKKDIYFPLPDGSAEPLISAGEKIMNKEGNAGTLYLTINPSSVDWNNKPLLLVNTANEQAPVTLSPATASNKVISFTTRAANGLYATDATVAAEDIEKINFNYMTDDIDGMKQSIKNFLNERNKHNLADLAQRIINVFNSNKMVAYRVQANWGDNYSTFSDANIAAIALKPLTYDFDLNSAAEYNGTSLNALEKLENKVLTIISPNESSREKVWKWIDKFNKEVAAKVLNNVNAAIQPTMLYESNGKVAHMHAGGAVNTIKAGEVKLFPTSWTAELLAPAFKKYVALTEVTDLNGTPLNGVVNTGNMGKIIDGKINTIPFTIEAGKIYTIVYTAMDYSGLTRTLTYTIKGE